MFRHLLQLPLEIQYHQSDSISTDLLSWRQFKMPAAHVRMAMISCGKMEGEFLRLIESPGGPRLSRFQCLCYLAFWSHLQISNKVLAWVCGCKLLQSTWWERTVLIVFCIQVLKETTLWAEKIFAVVICSLRDWNLFLLSFTFFAGFFSKFGAKEGQFCIHKFVVERIVSVFTYLRLSVSAKLW